MNFTAGGVSQIDKLQCGKAVNSNQNGIARPNKFGDCPLLLARSSTTDSEGQPVLDAEGVLQHWLRSVHNPEMKIIWIEGTGSQAGQGCQHVRVNISAVFVYL